MLTPRRDRKLLLSLLAAILLGVACVTAATPRIRNVSGRGGRLTITNSSGRRPAVVTAPAGASLIGFNDEFCIVGSGSELLFYDVRGRLYNRVDTAVTGRVIYVAGQTFTAGTDSVRTTFDAHCRLLSVRRILPASVVDTCAVGDSVPKLE